MNEREAPDGDRRATTARARQARPLRIRARRMCRVAARMAHRNVGLRPANVPSGVIPENV